MPNDLSILRQNGDNLPVKQEEKKASPYDRKVILLDDGSSFVLSKKEMCICEEFIATNGNLAEVARRVNVKFKRNHSASTISQWLSKRNLILRYLKLKRDNRAEVENFTEEDWKLIGIQAMRGRRKMDPVMQQLWRSWGQFVVNKEVVKNTINVDKAQINFLQQDGEK